MNIEWLEPWWSLEERPDLAKTLEAELERELAPSHQLFGISVEAIGKRGDCDDVLFRLLDGSNRVAVIHLTWRGTVEVNSIWPLSVIYDDLEAWIENGLKPDHVDFV